MKNLYLFLMLFSLSLTAQNHVGSIDIDYKNSFYSDKESINISNDKTNELVFLVDDTDKTIITLLDNQFKKINTLETEELNNKFKKFIGYSISGDTYTVFFKDNKDKKFGYVDFNFKTQKVTQSKIELKFESEKFVEGITHNNIFYLMTVDKKTDNVNFYEFTNDKSFLKHPVSFYHAVYTSDGMGSTKHPYEILTSSAWSGNSGSLTKIDLNMPNSIETTSDKVKLYQIEDELIFTFDNQNTKTKVISINTKDFTSKEYDFDKPKLMDDSFSSSDNSFINNGILYQAICSSDEMILTVKYLKNNNLIKEFTVYNDIDTIEFKNSPIIQENSSIWFKDNKRVRELEKSSKFLRKVSNGKLGIVAFPLNNNIQLTIGGYTERSGGGFGGMPMMGGGIPMGGFALGGGFTGTMSFNPFMSAYNSYSYTKSTRIECLFDTSFNHVEGEISKNIFDKIHEHEKIIEVEKRYDLGLNRKNVFRHNNRFYLSYIDERNKKYHIIEFSE
ncbi:hypothetical protein ACFQZF_02680 [Flavobacterium myungsuense]|uniref:Uncharacterized protein n=1 Tax=Flavobacterium myungsuense TaxID=651823 RepID=A0ABW3J3C3_9FLAO